MEPKPSLDTQIMIDFLAKYGIIVSSNSAYLRLFKKRRLLATFVER
jgi:hypothetical protein